jgi:hypothetical protein
MILELRTPTWRELLTRALAEPDDERALDLVADAVSAALRASAPLQPTAMRRVARAYQASGRKISELL